MKHRTIWWRLNTALALLVVLLSVCFFVAFRIESVRLDTVHLSDQLDNLRDRVHLDLTQISDAVRGQVLDPKNEIDRKRRRDAEVALGLSMDGILAPPLDHPELREAIKKYPELTGAVKRLREFMSGTPGLAGFHNQVVDMAERDPASASGYYNKNFPEIRDKRDRLFGDLTQKIEAVQEGEAIRARTIAVAGGASIVLILIACFVVGRLQSSAVTRPLNRLVASLELMRSGDFTQRLALQRNDEFGVVSDGLNRLADDLSEVVGQVQRSGIQVNTTATQIAATAREQQSTANEIAATTAQIGATSKEISATSKELVKTMNEVNQVAEDTANLAGSGQTAIGRMESTMRHIMEASGSITGKLAVLSEKTTNINSVVTTITKVADQTNLLSLNAAIEAEKAGEYGLGFAVVAMEIRRLADQTAVATYDIEKMVKEMQSAVAAGVMGMDKFSEEVRRGVEEIRQVSTQLAQLIHQVLTLTPRFQTVNEGMHAQATGAQQISEPLTQKSEAAHQTAESLRQSTLAIEQLNGAARGLQTSVARFKLAS